MIHQVGARSTPDIYPPPRAGVEAFPRFSGTVGAFERASSAGALNLRAGLARAFVGAKIAIPARKRSAREIASAGRDSSRRVSLTSRLFLSALLWRAKYGRWCNDVSSAKRASRATRRRVVQRLVVQRGRVVQTRDESCSNYPLELCKPAAERT